MKTEFKFSAKTIIIPLVILFAVVLVFNCFTVVDAGHTGVVVTLGKVNDRVLQEGKSEAKRS